MNTSDSHVRPAWQTLFPEEKTPYLIVAPPYTAMSAGIRVLHALCHSLNMIGERAYITIVPQLAIDINSEGLQINPEFCTPTLNADRVRMFETQGRSPIVIYPETIPGNPLNASRIVRYVLNYPGLLGGDATFDENEIRFAYTKQLAEHMGLGDDRILFMPTSDPTIFYPPPEGSVRSGSCFYASKYHDFHKGELLPVTANSVEITRYKPDSLSKQQIAELFRRSEVFYTYEDTALATEAALCGCPTVVLPNEFLQKSLASIELGTNGVAWGDAPEALVKAKATVHLSRDKYMQHVANYMAQLQRFVDITQTEAKKIVPSMKPGSAITLPEPNRFHLINTAFNYIHRYGFRETFVRALRFIRKFGPRRVLRYAMWNV